MAPSAVPSSAPPASVPAATTKTVGSSYSTVAAAIEAAQARFIERNPISLKLHQDAVEALPGGNTRSLLYTAPFPLSMRQGKEYKVFDEDGHEYVDFVGELTAGLYGHSNPVIGDTIKSTIDNVGLNLGATTRLETQHAALLCARFHLERVRFCNSGTEANLHALAGARRFTGRRKVVVFRGGYHGAVLSFGDGVAVNDVDRDDWVLARYNDVEDATRKIEETGEECAAVLVEGMQGAGGALPGTKEFLLAVQEAAKKVSAVFILDEVMTSRLSPGGIAPLLSLTPDLTTFGKYLGGGLAFGAFGGRAAIMSVFDPRNPTALTQNGTFNNNTLAMAAGHAGLSRVYTPEVSVAFNAAGDAFREALAGAAQGSKMFFTGRGTLVGVHFADGGDRGKSVWCKEEVDERWDLKDLFWFEMMEEGWWLTRRGSVAVILGTPKEEMDRFVGAVKRFLERHWELVKV